MCLEEPSGFGRACAVQRSGQAVLCTLTPAVEKFIVRLYSHVGYRTSNEVWLCLLGLSLFIE